MSKTGKIILASILITIAAQIVHFIDAQINMACYMDPAYAAVWSKLMMSGMGPPPASFFITSVAFGFITALLLALVYNAIKIGIPGQTIIQKGLFYGLVVFLVSGLGGALALYLCINLPLVLIVSWAVEGLIIDLLAGVIIAWLI